MSQNFTEQNKTLTLGRSVNTDFTTTEVNKVAYDKGFYLAFKAAGFDSVRFFIKQGWESEWNAKQPYKKCSEVPLSLFQKGVAGKSKKKRTKKKQKN